MKKHRERFKVIKFLFQRNNTLLYLITNGDFLDECNYRLESSPRALWGNYEEFIVSRDKCNCSGICIFIYEFVCSKRWLWISIPPRRSKLFCFFTRHHKDWILRFCSELTNGFGQRRCFFVKKRLLKFNYPTICCNPLRRWYYITIQLYPNEKWFPFYQEFLRVRKSVSFRYNCVQSIDLHCPRAKWLDRTFLRLSHKYL